MIGVYEKDMWFWVEEGMFLDFVYDFFFDDLDWIMENVMCVVECVFCVEIVGVKWVINGLMIWSLDFSVFWGFVLEFKNYFFVGGIIPGFS